MFKKIKRIKERVEDFKLVKKLLCPFILAGRDTVQASREVNVTNRDGKVSVTGKLILLIGGSYFARGNEDVELKNSKHALDLADQLSCVVAELRKIASQLADEEARFPTPPEPKGRY
ncbi:MAG: hypothetical protein M0000_06390 [Actinomycetota bacterium]|nr:hypothetical protein [Actinomycetota bacterium]